MSGKHQIRFRENAAVLAVIFLWQQEEKLSQRQSGDMPLSSRRHNNLQQPGSLSALQKQSERQALSVLLVLLCKLMLDAILPGDIDFCSVGGKHGNMPPALIDRIKKTGQVQNVHFIITNTS